MTTSGKRNKRDLRRLGTPAFPIHVEGYDPKAADAPRVDVAGAGPRPQTSKT